MGTTNTIPVFDDPDFITKEEASDILGKHARTIARYIDSGILQAAHKNKKVGVSRQSLYRLKEDIEKEMNPTRAILQKLESRLLVAEGRISAMMRMLNMRYEPLILTDPEVKNLYEMVVHSAKAGWMPHNEEMFIDTFLKLTDTFLDQVEKLTEDKHPWRPFLMLASTMKQALYDRVLKPDIELAVSHLMVLAEIWCRRKGETIKASDLLLFRDSAPLKTLINKINHEKVKNRIDGEV